MWDLVETDAPVIKERYVTSLTALIDELSHSLLPTEEVLLNSVQLYINSEENKARLKLTLVYELTCPLYSQKFRDFNLSKDRINCGS